MTAFNYPPASASTLAGNGFYRINALQFPGLPGGLEVGVGDLIPINVGFNAIAVGPDSDFDKYELYYPDPLADGDLQQALFSAKNPFIGLISPDNVAEYPNTFGEKAIAFVRPIVSPNPAAFTQLGSNPEVDIIVYTKALPSVLPRGRVDKNCTGYIPVGASPILPVHSISGYGREHFQCLLANETLSSSVDVIVQGINADYPANQSGGIAEKVLEYELVASTTVSAGDRFKYVHNSRVDGFFDFFSVIVTTAGSDILPSDSTSQQSIWLSLEVRD
jgi:hypothetical protein